MAGERRSEMKWHISRDLSTSYPVSLSRESRPCRPGSHPPKDSIGSHLVNSRPPRESRRYLCSICHCAFGPMPSSTQCSGRVEPMQWVGVYSKEKTHCGCHLTCGRDLAL